MSEETFCYIRPSYVSGDDISFPTTKVLEAMKANLNVKHLQFQYIGLKTGLFINYPSTRLRDCDSYDPRFRYMNKCISCYDKQVCIKESDSQRSHVFIIALCLDIPVLCKLQSQPLYTIHNT